MAHNAENFGFLSFYRKSLVAPTMGVLRPCRSCVRPTLSLSQCIEMRKLRNTELSGLAKVTVGKWPTGI